MHASLEVHSSLELTAVAAATQTPTTRLTRGTSYFPCICKYNKMRARLTLTYSRMRARLPPYT